MFFGSNRMKVGSFPERKQSFYFVDGSFAHLFEPNFAFARVTRFVKNLATLANF